MSYNIVLYNRDFLRRSIAEQSGDWTNADAISRELVEAITNACVAEGFQAELHPPGFVEFLRNQGVTPSQDFALLTSTMSARMSIFPGSISFVVEASPVALASIEYCSDIARKLATEFNLGYYDGQSGEVIV
jgi:hypothetical protein